MNIAYLGRFPFCKFGLIAAAAETVSVAAQDWFADVMPSTSRRTENRLEREISPLTSVPTKRLIVDIGANVSLLLDNGAYGSDPGWMRYLGELTSCDTAYAVLLDPSVREAQNVPTHLGAYAISYWGADKKRRSIYLTDEGSRWSFEMFGVPFPFEDEKKYTRRRLKERFQRPDVISFLNNVLHFNFDTDLGVKYEKTIIFELSNTDNIKNLSVYPFSI